MMHARINERCELTQETTKTITIKTSCTNDSIANAKSGATANSKEDINKLSQRVDSLEHELMYLKLKSEWEIFKSDVSHGESDYNIKANALQINFYNKNFDYGLYKSYKRNYDACVSNLSAKEDLFDSMREGLNIELLTHDFSEMERLFLQKLYETTKSTLNAAKSSLNFYKVALDVYGKYI